MSTSSSTLRNRCATWPSPFGPRMLDISCFFAMENIIIAFLICATIYFLANPVSVPRREPLAQAADDQQDSTGVPSPHNSTTHHPRHGLDPGLRQSLLLGGAESAGDWAGAGEVQNGGVRPTRGSTRGFGPGTLGAAMVFGVKLRRLSE